MEDDLRCLEFDHREPAKKVAEVANLVRSGTPWLRILTEIEKCDVRCANCHRRITSQRGKHWRQAIYEQSRAELVAEMHVRLDRVFQPG